MFGLFLKWGVEGWNYIWSASRVSCKSRATIDEDLGFLKPPGGPISG